MIQVAVAGCFGRMGGTVVEAVNAEKGMAVACGIDPKSVGSGEAASFPVFATTSEALDAVACDVLVDFTQPSAVADNIEAALARSVDCVIGTTGLSKERLEALYWASSQEACLFYAPNFTIGAVLMMQFAKMCAPYFPEAEIIEFHHDRKLDAPSGTAVQTAALISQGRDGRVSQAPGRETEVPGAEGARGALIDGVPVHSVRSAAFVANQEVIFGSLGQALAIRHESWDRHSYMPGVILAIRSVQGRTGLIIGLEHFLDIG